MKTREMVLTGLMIAVVYAVTVAIAVPVPQTRGYFNLGEAAIYAAALLFGPVVGGLAGGLGSMAADLAVAPHYAIFTLVIKGAEGLIVGLLARGSRPSPRTVAALAVGALAAVVLGAALVWRAPAADWPARPPAIALAVFVGFVAVLVAVLPLAARGRPSAGPGPRRALAAMLAGGVVMVGGYFFTQAVVFGLGPAVAAAELPVNVVQVGVGIAAGLTAAAAVRRALPDVAR